MSAGAAGAGPALVLVAALARNRAIGRDNALPWHISADLKRFKALTLGKPVLMGRKTYQSIGRALPGRDNLVLTRESSFEGTGVQVFRALDEALASVSQAELMVIGGGEIYAQAIPRATRMHLTLVDAEVEGDVFFPPFDARCWRVERHEEHPAGGDGTPGFGFVDYVRG